MCFVFIFVLCCVVVAVVIVDIVFDTHKRINLKFDHNC